MKKNLIIGLTVVLSVMLSGCHEETALTFPNTQPETFTLKKEMTESFLSLTGTVEANKSIQLSSKISGRIESLLVDVGNQVQQNQVVAQFSATDDQTQIAYNNALNQLQSTKTTVQSHIESANTALVNAQQQHQQNQQQSRASTQQLIESLKARTNSTHRMLEQILSFIDMTLGASPKFQYGTNASVVSDIGSNDIIGKQNIKNEIIALVRFTQSTPFPYNTEAIANAQQEVDALKRLKTGTQHFYALLRNTPASSRFPETERQTLQQKTETSLTELSNEIFILETQITTTLTKQEQLELSLVQTENMVKNAAAQVKLSQSSAEQQVQLATNQIVATGNLRQELRLKAPFAGIITQRFTNEGSLTAAGQTIFELADRSKLKIKTQVPDTSIGQITEQMPVEIKLDGLTQTFTGKISRLDPAVDTSTRTLGIEITFDKSPATVRLGMFARIKISLGEKAAFFVPKRFVQAQFSGPAVTTTQQGILPVKIGEDRDGFIEIIADSLTENLVLIHTP